MKNTNTEARAPAHHISTARGDALATATGGASANGRMRVAFVDLYAGYDARRGDIDVAMQEVIESSDFILGQAVTDFERDFASYCEVEHAVGVDSGLSALELTLRSHDVGPGDEVITAANTFIATVAAIEIVGARPVLVDMLPDSYTMDPERVRAAITPATKAVIPVHLYGQCADMAAIGQLAVEHGLYVFEDACQAHGASYRGQRAGSLGSAAAFSFYPSKNLGAFGDGGMVVTNDADVATRLRQLRNLGTSRKYHHDARGFNRRLDTLHAAVLKVKLRHLDEDNAARAAIAAQYTDGLHDLPITTPTIAADRDHVFHLYVIETEDRAGIEAHLRDAGIATGIHYPIPVHLQPPYRALGQGKGSFPVTERAARRILSLPMYPGMPMNAVSHTVESLLALYGR